MQRMCWVRSFECAAVLFTFLQFQGAVGNEMSEPDHGESYICSCTIDDKVYNLAPLKSRDGSPRFVEQLLYMKSRSLWSWFSDYNLRVRKVSRSWIVTTPFPLGLPVTHCDLSGAVWDAYYNYLYLCLITNTSWIMRPDNFSGLLF